MKKVEYKQLDLTDCGAACLASVSSHYNLNIPLTKIRGLAGTNQKGTNLLGMMEAAKELGFESKALRVNNKDLDKLPLPFIAHLNIKKQWFHFVVVYQVKSKYVLVMDPAFGKIQKVNKTDFIKDWTEVSLLLEKSLEFKEGNFRKGNFSRFNELIKPFRSSFTEAFLAACIYSALGISTSIFVEKLIDNIIPSQNLVMLNILSLVFGLILLSRLFIGFAKNLLLLRTGLKIDSKLIMAYYRHVLRLPMKFFNTMRTGEIISRINDAVKIRAFINNVALDLTVNVLIVFFTLIVMLSYSLQMSLIVLAGIPVYYTVYVLFNRFNKKHIRISMEKNASLESSLLESFKGIEPIKTTVNEDSFIEKLDKKSIGFLNSGFRVNKSFSIAALITEFIAVLQLLLILWLGSKFVISGKLSTGELLSFYTLFGYLSAPLFKLILSNKNLQDALIATDRLFQIMDMEQEVDNKKDILEERNSSPARLKIENISFKFPGQPELLKKINFSCRPYTITTIVGESGTGKSTLLTLLLKLNTISKGNIYFNDTNYENLSLGFIRKNIAYVPQSPVLFSGTIKENIVLGNLPPDIKKLTKIAEDTGLNYLLKSLPDQLNTLVTENGDNFSGGEKQKISIARALYPDPSIILFDEPTSSMDSISEEKFNRLLYNLKRKGKTIIIVSHKIISTTNSDNIIVLKNGNIAEEGKFEELIQNNASFYNFYEKQNPSQINSENKVKRQENQLIFK